MKQTVTVPELCKALGLPETTGRRFLRAFEAFFPVAATGRPVRYRGEAVEVLRLVVTCHAQGMSQAETEAALSRAGFAREADPAARHQPPTASQAPITNIVDNSLVVRLVEAMERQNALLERQNELLENLARAGVALPEKSPSISPQEAPGDTEGARAIEPDEATPENASEGRMRPPWWKRLWKRKA